ncbi:MAG TPA: rRNA maturation RNase YbeY [Acidimicrobiales bacterium]|nr:rRNA maturation RNase YbeY [Acidimicrobiales bacterium]
MTAPTTAPIPTGPDRRTDERPRAIVTDDRPPDSEPSVDADALAALAEAALGALGVTGRAELSVTFVDEATIAELNREHLGGSGSTDVLSFPLEDSDAVDPIVPGAPRLLGDLVICPEVAAANAPDHAGTFDDEMALLCVHGILHVLGWDHAERDEARAMRAEEARVLGLVHREVAAGTEIP